MILTREQINLQIKQAKQASSSLNIPMIIMPILFIGANIILYFAIGIPMFSIIFGILTGLVLFAMMAAVMSARDKQLQNLNTFIKRINLYFELLQRTEIPEKTYGFDHNSSFSAPQLMWFIKDSIHFFPKPPTFGNHLLYDQIGENQIPYKSIKYYYTSGDKYYENKLSGGGSTGPNLVGAMIGEEIAGVGGAVVMGQSRINPVTSQLIIHDERRTVIAYKNEDGSIAQCLIPFDFYDIMVEHLPDLRRDFVEMKMNASQIKQNALDNNGDNIEAKLKKLLDMKNAGLIDENDYRIQKEKLLEKM